MILSIVSPYYNQPQMLAVQGHEVAKHPQGVEFVLVDDGSREHPAPIMPGMRQFRVLKDVPWNQDAARNIGADEASGDWLLLTDLDHVFAATAVRDILALIPTLARRAYRFRRALASTGKALWPAPNVWLMPRDLFWRIGGYDERHAGTYGTDREFSARVAAVCAIGILPVSATVYTSADVPDASSALPRDPQRVETLPGRPVTLSCEYEALP